MLSCLFPLIWMVSLCVNGLLVEPAERLPALTWMKLAIMVTSLVSSIIRLPSIVKLLIGAGSTSSSSLHSPFTVTLSPATGTTPLGHWVALLHFLTKSSRTNVPGAGGQSSSQITPVTDVYSKRDLFFPLWQRVNIRKLVSLLVLSW